MKLIHDDEHIKTEFGYNRVNIRYKQCVRCRATRTEYRETHREELRENANNIIMITKKNSTNTKWNMPKYIMAKP